VDKILRKISQNLISSPDDNVKLHKYENLKDHPGWPVHQELLLLMRGSIAETLLSKSFTKLNEKEKDVRQRAYFQVDQIIQFLLNPAGGAAQYLKLKKHNQRMDSATK